MLMTNKACSSVQRPTQGLDSAILQTSGNLYSKRISPSHLTSTDWSNQNRAPALYRKPCCTSPCFYPTLLVTKGHCIIPRHSFRVWSSPSDVLGLNSTQSGHDTSQPHHFAGQAAMASPQSRFSAFLATVNDMVRQPLTSARLLVLHKLLRLMHAITKTALSVRVAIYVPPMISPSLPCVPSRLLLLLHTNKDEMGRLRCCFSGAAGAA